MMRRLLRGALRAPALLTVCALLLCATGSVCDEPAQRVDTHDAAEDSLASVEPVEPLPDRVVIYYFHRTIRCATCLKFETYTDEAIHTAFDDELGAGVLEWRVLNFEDAGNEHFVDDYNITESSVIAVEFRDGKQQSWANLDAIWGFVGTKKIFLSYIEGEVEFRLNRTLNPEPTSTDAVDGVDPLDNEPTGR